MQILLSEVEERHAALVGLLQRAEYRRHTAAIPGEVRDNTDRFLAAASRHGAATARVLLPAVKRHLGRAEIRDFVRLSRRLERVLVRAKAKQYGGAQNVHHSWNSVWNGVRSRLTQTLAAERRLVGLLSQHLGHADQRRLRTHFTLAVAAAPTRPHPCLPRTGPAGHLTRLICARFDAVWDELEGRVTSPALVSRVLEHAAPVDVVGRQRHQVLLAQRPPQLDQPASLPEA
jgi:hypothetical protein